MKLTPEQEIIKNNYELFKESELLDDQDKKFIEQTETILKPNKKILAETYEFIYNKNWINNWIKTSNIKKVIERHINEMEIDKEMREREMLKYLKAKYEGKGKITKKQIISELARKLSEKRKLQIIVKEQKDILKTTKK